MASYDYEEFYNHYEKHEDDGTTTVIQQGTPLDAKHFNCMGKGLYRAGLQQYYFIMGTDGYFHVLVDQTETDEEGLVIEDDTTIDGLVEEATKHVSQVTYGDTSDD